MVLAVGGEIDVTTAPALETAIADVLADEPSILVIDFSGVQFLGSAGLRILAQTAEKVGESAHFAVVASGPVTSRPIQVTGLDDTFSLYATVDDALCAIGTNI